MNEHTKDLSLIELCEIACVAHGGGCDPYDMAAHVFYGMDAAMYLEGYRYDFANATSERLPNGNIQVYYPLYKDGKRVEIQIKGVRLEGKLIQKINVEVD